MGDAVSAGKWLIAPRDEPERLQRGDSAEMRPLKIKITHGSAVGVPSFELGTAVARFRAVAFQEGTSL